MSEKWRPLLFSALEIVLVVGFTGTIKTIICVDTENDDECEVFYSKVTGIPVHLTYFRLEGVQKSILKKGGKWKILVKLSPLCNVGLLNEYVLELFSVFS